MKPHFCFRVWCALLVLTAPVCFAEGWQSPEINCALDFPPGWSLITLPQPQVRAAAQSPDKNKFLIVLCEDRPDLAANPSDDKIISGFEEKIYGSGRGKKTTSKKIEMGGQPGFESVGSLHLRENQASIIMQVTVADGRVYALQAISSLGEASQNADIAECLRSFRFLKPPAAPAIPARTGSSSMKKIFMVLTGAGLLVSLALALYQGRLLRSRSR